METKSLTRDLFSSHTPTRLLHSRPVRAVMVVIMVVTQHNNVIESRIMSRMSMHNVLMYLYAISIALISCDDNVFTSAIIFDKITNR